MRNIDWTFWGTLAVLVAILLVGFLVSGCAILQPKPKPVIPIKTLVKPTVQLWYAARASNWLVTMSILGIAGGVFATLNGQKWGMAVIVSCSVSLFMSLAVARFAWWMAVCGLLGSVGICVASILSRRRNLVEIIKGGELFKKALNVVYTEPEAEIELFEKAQTEAQKSKSTQKIVQKIKSKMKLEERADA